MIQYFFWTKNSFDNNEQYVISRIQQCLLAELYSSYIAEFMFQVLQLGSQGVPPRSCCNRRGGDGLVPSPCLGRRS